MFYNDEEEKEDLSTLFVAEEDASKEELATENIGGAFEEEIYEESSAEEETEENFVEEEIFEKEEENEEEENSIEEESFVEEETEENFVEEEIFEKEEESEEEENPIEEESFAEEETEENFVEEDIFEKKEENEEEENPIEEESFAEEETEENFVEEEIFEKKEESEEEENLIEEESSAEEEMQGNSIEEEYFTEEKIEETEEREVEEVSTGFSIEEDEFTYSVSSETAEEETEEQQVSGYGYEETENKEEHTIAEKNTEEKVKEKVKEKSNKKKRKRIRCKGGGGLGCFLGILSSIFCTIALILTAGYFLLDGFLVSQFSLRAKDCFDLISAIWSVDESKVLTEGSATDDDRKEFYSTLADTLFIKDQVVEEVVDKALDDYIVPVIGESLNGTGGGYSSSAPRLEDGGEDTDLQSYLISLLEKGIIDENKINAYFDNQLSAEEKYDEYFVIDITGKGIVSTVDYVINETLLANPKTAPLVHTFGISQVKFTSSEQAGSSFKQINLVLDVKPQKAIIAFLESEMGYEMIGESAGIIRQFAGILPQRLLLSVDFNIEDSQASIDFRLNNLTNEDVAKWFNFIYELTGSNLKATIDESINSAYGEIRQSLIDYVDINTLIGNGSLNVDLFDILASVLNKERNLVGNECLTKYEATTAISNILYATLGFNEKAIEKIVEEEAPYYLSENWKEETEEDFLKWIHDNLALKDKEEIEKVIKEFEDETGEIVLPTQYTAFLEFIDTEYLREEGTEFLKNQLKFDDRYVAYLFETIKKPVFESAGFATLADALVLQYVSIQKPAPGTHDYLALGLSAKTEDMCKALGFDDFAFVSSLIGKELFIGVKADVTLDKDIARSTPEFRLNGLSPKQTAEILNTIKKITGYDIVEELINKNIDLAIDKIVDMVGDKFSAGFDVKEGTTTGMLVLPSIANILEIIIAESEINVNGEDVIDAIGNFLKSKPVSGEYTQFLADTSSCLGSDFKDYDEVVSKAFLSKYFLSEDKDINDILEILINAIGQKEGALDELLGTNEVKGLININANYFVNNSTLQSTQPVIDGHTLAHIITAGKETLSSLLGKEVASYLEFIDVKDALIENGYLSLTVATTPKKFLSIDGIELDKYVTNFIYGIFGGEDEDVTITLKVNIADNKEKIFIYVQDMSKEEMQSIFDLLTGLGITLFDFDDPNNTLVEFANTIAEYVKNYATVEGNTVSLPSVFGLISAFINNSELTEEVMFNAVKALVTSEADTFVGYKDAQMLAQANEILTGNKNSGKSYAQLVKDNVESKYLIKEDKNLGDVIAVVGKNDMVNSLTGEEGPIEISRANLAGYFNVNDELEKTNPVLDGHTLAYVIDNYKNDIAINLNFNESATKILENIDFVDVTVDKDSVMSIRTVLDMTKVISAISEEGIANQFLNVLEDSKKTLSITLVVSLKDNTSKFVVNDMSDEEFESINSLLKAFGINLFDMEDKTNPLSSNLKKFSELINKYMPYDEEKKVFKISSIFDLIAKFANFGDEIQAEDVYTLLKEVSVYDDNITPDTYEEGEFEKYLNDQTKRYYAIDDGVEVFKKAKNGELDINDVSINENIKTEAEYDQSFIYDEQYLLPFIKDGLGVETGNDAFTLNRITVVEDDIINVNVIVSVENLDISIDKFIKDILPSSLSVTVPISFNSAKEHGDWTIEGMGNLDKIKEIFAKVGFDIDKTINDARDSILGLGNANSLQGTFDDYGLKFVEGGIQMPSLTTLYSSIDLKNKDGDTTKALSSDEVKLLIEDVVRNDAEINILDYSTSDYKENFNNLASEYYGVKDDNQSANDGGFVLIKSAVDGELDEDNLVIDRDLIKANRKHKESFMYDQQYLVPFVKGLGLYTDDQKLMLNSIEVKSENKVVANVVVSVENMIGSADFGPFMEVLPTYLSVVVPVDFNEGATQESWSIVGVNDLDALASALSKYGIDVKELISNNRKKLIESVNKSFEKYSIAFDKELFKGEEVAGLKLPALTTLYEVVDDTFTSQQISILIDNLVCYDDNNAIENESVDGYDAKLNQLTQEYYAIDNGYSTISSLVKGKDFSVDELSIDKSNFDNVTRKYASSFIYEEEYLATFIKDLALFNEKSGYEINAINVTGKDCIVVDLIVNIDTVSGNATYGAMKQLLPTALAIQLPINFATNDHGKWTIVGMDNADDVLVILKDVIGVDIEYQVSTKRDEFKTQVGDKLNAHCIKFDIEEEKEGLLLPSICTLYANEKGDDFSEEDAIYLFDNLVCYKEQYHSIFGQEEDQINLAKQIAKDEFMSIMKNHYLIKEKYSGLATMKYYDDETGEISYANVYEQVDNIDVTYELLLTSFGFNLKGYDGYYVPTSKLMDIPTDKNSFETLMGSDRLNYLKNDVLIKNEIVTLWIESVGVDKKFEIEEIIVTANDKIRFTGFVDRAEFMNDICQTADSLMVDRLNVTMEINLNPTDGKYVESYYIEDLVGTYNSESGNYVKGEDFSESQKLLGILNKLDANIDVDDEDFNVFAEEIAETLNGMLNNIDGIDPFNGKREEKSKAVYYENAGDIPTELVKFDTNSGFYLPDGASYAYKYSAAFRNAFDAFASIQG